LAGNLVYFLVHNSESFIAKSLGVCEGEGRHGIHRFRLDSVKDAPERRVDFGGLGGNFGQLGRRDGVEQVGEERLETGVGGRLAPQLHVAFAFNSLHCQDCRQKQLGLLATERCGTN
jgi:hypothetical protein